MKKINYYTISSYLIIAIILFVPITITAQPTVFDAFPKLEFSRPTDFKPAPTSSTLVFVAQKGGLVYALENDTTTGTRSVFLDIQDQVLSKEEQGLFSIAFHPDHANNGYFYVHHTAADPRRSVLARYRVKPGNPQNALEGSRKVLLEVDQPHSTHNGGELEFGPDGYLYASFGDGKVTKEGDPFENGQDRTTLLGTVIRINVDSTAMGRNYAIPSSNPFVGDSTCGDGSQACRGEIYAYGFRNPWQFNFDSKTGRLWLGDVGHASYEEIDVIEKGGNYGWSIMEGEHCFDPPTGCDTTGLTLPVYEYAHDEMHRSVTGGVVYRGKDLPSLQGKYIYADYVVNTVFTLKYDKLENDWMASRKKLFEDVINVVSLDTDRRGEIYMCSFDGNIYKIGNESDTGIDDRHDVPNQVVLQNNYPNPFNPSTRIRYRLDRPMHVTLEVYNPLGQKISVLVDRRHSAGKHHVTFQADKQMASGVYYYRLTTPGETRTETMTLMK